MSETLILGLISLASAFFTVVFPWLSSRRVAENETRKNDAAAEVSLAGAWRELVDPLREEIAQLRDRTTTLQEKVDNQEQQLLAQRSQLQQQEQHEALLRHELSKVFDWVDHGALPPPPARPAWLKPQ